MSAVKGAVLGPCVTISLVMMAVALCAAADNQGGGYGLVACVSYFLGLFSLGGALAFGMGGLMINVLTQGATHGIDPAHNQLLISICGLDLKEFLGQVGPFVIIFALAYAFAAIANYKMFCTVNRAKQMGGNLLGQPEITLQQMGSSPPSAMPVARPVGSPVVQANFVTAGSDSPPVVQATYASDYPATTQPQAFAHHPTPFDNGGVPKKGGFFGMFAPH